MVKKLFIILLALVLVAVMTGFYPVALVGRSLILARTLRKVEEAKKNFINTQSRSLKLQPIVFSTPANKELASAIKKQSLTLLIEDKTIELEGSKMIPDFSALAQKRLNESLQDEKDAEMEKAVRTVYGLGLKDFFRMILLPQARRDVMRIFLANQGKNFEEWLAQAENGEKIRLFFSSSDWNGREVK